MDAYKRTKYKFSINKLKYPVYVTRNAKHVVFVEGRKKYVDMSKHPSMSGGTVGKRPREDTNTNLSPNSATTAPKRPKENANVVAPLDYQNLPDHVKDVVFKSYLDLVRNDMKELQNLNQKIPNKRNVSSLMDKLIAVYNNITVTKNNATQMGVSQTDSWDDFMDHMRELYMNNDNTPLDFLYTLNSGFDDIVVTYAKEKGNSKASKTVRIHVVEPEDPYTELKHDIRVIEANKPKRTMKKKLVKFDPYMSRENMDIFNNMSNLQRIKRIYNLLYVDVPVELEMSDDFYVQSIYIGCVVDYEKMNRWEFQDEISDCYFRDEHDPLRMNEDDSLTTRAIYEYRA